MSQFVLKKQISESRFISFESEVLRNIFLFLPNIFISFESKLFNLILKPYFKHTRVFFSLKSTTNFEAEKFEKKVISIDLFAIYLLGEIISQVRNRRLFPHNIYKMRIFISASQSQYKQNRQSFKFILIRKVVCNSFYNKDIAQEKIG